MKIIDVKNHYKVAALIRELLSIVAIITLIAAAVLSLNFALFTIPFCGLAAWHGYSIYSNKQAAAEIAATGRTNRLIR